MNKEFCTKCSEKLKIVLFAQVVEINLIQKIQLTKQL